MSSSYNASWCSANQTIVSWENELAPGFDLVTVFLFLQNLYASFYSFWCFFLHWHKHTTWYPWWKERHICLDSPLCTLEFTCSNGGIYLTKIVLHQELIHHAVFEEDKAHCVLITYILNGIYVTVCTWGCHFSIHKMRTRVSALASLLRVTATTQLTRCMHRHSCQNRSWCHQSIMWWCLASYGDIPMMYGISDDDIYIRTEWVQKENAWESFKLIGQC